MRQLCIHTVRALLYQREFRVFTDPFSRPSGACPIPSHSCTVCYCLYTIMFDLRVFALGRTRARSFACVFMFARTIPQRARKPHTHTHTPSSSRVCWQQQRASRFRVCVCAVRHPEFSLTSRRFDFNDREGRRQSARTARSHPAKVLILFMVMGARSRALIA